MTPTPHPGAARAPAPDDTARRAYAPPKLVTFGSVDALTAGPSFGTLDQLGGTSGGFLDDDRGSIDVAQPD